MRFCTRREQKNTRKLFFLEITQTARHLENVDFAWKVLQKWGFCARTERRKSQRRNARLGCRNASQAERKNTNSVKNCRKIVKQKGLHARARKKTVQIPPRRSFLSDLEAKLAQKWPPDAPGATRRGPKSGKNASGKRAKMRLKSRHPKNRLDVEARGVDARV